MDETDDTTTQMQDSVCEEKLACVREYREREKSIAVSSLLSSELAEPSSDITPGAFSVPGMVSSSSFYDSLKNVNNESASVVAFKRSSVTDTTVVAEEEQMPVQAELAPDLSQVLSQANPTELNFLTRADVVAPVRLWGKKRRLKFSSEAKEERFQDEHSHLARGILQVVLPISIVLYGVYHLWGTLVNLGYGRHTIIIRSMVLVIWIFFLILMRTDFFLRHAQLMTYMIAMCGYVGAVVIYSSVENGFEKGLPALGVVITACASCGAMLFPTAVSFCVSALVVSNVLIFVDPNPGSGGNSMKHVLFNTNFILFSFCLFSLLTSYNVEMHLRHRFRYTGTVSYWTNPDMLDDEDEEDEDETNPV